MTESPVLKLNPRIIAAKANALLEGFRQELQDIQAEREKMNSLPVGAGLESLVAGLGPIGGVSVTGQPWTLALANNYTPVTLNRILMSYSYMSQGLFRTVIDQPVEDAFRGGIKFKSGELDDEELKRLERTIKRKQGRRASRNTPATRAAALSGYNSGTSDLDAIKMTCKWARLYGGAGLIVNTNQRFTSELNVEAITEDSPLTFIHADRWELILSTVNIADDASNTPFNYYGYPLHVSRVCKMVWAEAPSYIRLRLQGWGMSVLEECIRPVNAFIKFESLLFELLDEAKIDVFKIKNFNTNLATAKGTDLINRRISLNNQLKNYQTALTMDVDDDYVQKQLAFSGLADIWEQIRQNLCAYLKMPMNKLFGQSAGGFGSGKDSLENYNAIVGNLRDAAEPLVMEVAELRCQQLFGFVPEDLEAEWTPLETMNGVEQEQVRTSAQGRTLAQLQAGLLDGKETSEVLRKQGLLLIESAVLKGDRDIEPPPTQNPGEAAAAMDHDKEMQKKKPAA